MLHLFLIVGGEASSNRNASRDEYVEAGDKSVEAGDESIEAGEKTPQSCYNHQQHTLKYSQVSDISLTLEGNKIVDHSDVVEASPVGAAPTTSSFST